LSQALPGFLITTLPSVCVPTVLGMIVGALVTWAIYTLVTKAPTIITKVPAKGHTVSLSLSLSLCPLRVLTTVSLCLLILGGIFFSRIPFDVFVTIVFQRSVARLLLSEVRNCGENRRVAITRRRCVMTHAMRSSSQSRTPVINFC